MLFERFFKTISNLIPPSVLLNLDALEQLDPERMYVENVRSVLRVPFAVAQKICDLGVRQGALRRMVSVECPDGSEAARAEDERQLPESVSCYVEEQGFLRQMEIPTSKLRHVTFYRLTTGATGAATGTGTGAGGMMQV